MNRTNSFLSRFYNNRCFALLALLVTIVLPSQVMARQGQASGPAEQVHLRFSQPFYASGDTVRFKAYLLTPGTLQPTRKSKVLEVEFRTPLAATTLHHRFRIENGLATGSFVLADSLGKGQYEVVGYTTARGANATEGIFRGRLRVIGPANEKAKADATTNPESISLSFFPEGGKLVAQVENRVAVKAVGQDGKGTGFTGQLVGSDGSTLNFQADKKGQGVILVNPKEGATYQIITRSPTEQTNLKAGTFPVVETSGVGLQIQTKKDSLLVKLSPSPAWVKANAGKNLRTAIKDANQVVVSQEMKVRSGAGLQVSIPTRNLPQGLLQLTVSGPGDKVEAQRFVLVQHPQQLKVQVRTDRQRYGRREPIRISATVTDAAGLPVPDATLAFAVRPKTQTAQSVVSSLEQDLLVGGAQGLFSTNPEEVSMLDWALLTLPEFQNLKPAASTGSEPESSTEEDLGMKMEGRVIDEKGNAIGSATVLLYSRESFEPMLQVADENGVFSFQSVEFDMPRHYVFEILQGGRRVDQAKIVWFNQPVFKPSAPLPLRLTEAEALYLRQADIRKQTLALFNPKIETPAQATEEDTTLVLLSELGSPNQSYDLSQYVAFRDMAEIIKETMPLASVVSGPRGREIRIISPERTGTKFKEHPLFFVDGNPVLNNDWVLSLAGNRIKKIDLFYADRKLRNLGLAGRHGVLSITTHAPHPGPAEIQDKNAFAWSGLSAPATFTSPSYEYSVPRPAPDFRSLLYWAPEVRTDANGKASVVFYTSDDVGEFEVTVEAYQAKGQAGSQREVFSIVPTF